MAHDDHRTDPPIAEVTFHAIPRAAILAILLVSCGSRSWYEDAGVEAVQDSILDQGDEDTGSVQDVMDDEDMQDVVWQECTTFGVLDTDFTGPGSYADFDVTIDATGTVSAISVDWEGRWTLDVDFSAADPDIGTVSFTLPPGVGDAIDLAVDDAISVVYHLALPEIPSGDHDAHHRRVEAVEENRVDCLEDERMAESDAGGRYTAHDLAVEHGRGNTTLVRPEATSPSAAGGPRRRGIP